MKAYCIIEFIVPY